MSEKPSVLTKAAKVVGSMSPALKRTLLVILIGFLCLLVGWVGRGVLTAPPSDSATMTAYESWQVICPSAKEKDASCSIIRDVVDEKTNQQVGRVAISRDKDKKEATLILTVPLGVLLQPGLGFRLGADAAKTYQYSTCTSVGCSVVTPLDEKLLSSMLAAQDAAFTIATPNPQERNGVDVTFSMKGFAKAEKAYRTGEAKRKSLWWRLWL